MLSIDESKKLHNGVKINLKSTCHFTKVFSKYGCYTTRHFILKCNLYPKIFILITLYFGGRDSILRVNNVFDNP